MVFPSLVSTPFYLFTLFFISPFTQDFLLENIVDQTKCFKVPHSQGGNAFLGSIMPLKGGIWARDMLAIDDFIVSSIFVPIFTLKH